MDLAGARRAAFRLVLFQAVVTLVVASGFLAFAGGRSAISALVGGGISVVASLAMALLAFSSPRSGDPKLVMRGFYRGEAVKLGLTVVLLVVALRSGSLEAAPLLAAFIATLAAYWVALIRN
jgi:ATP synthase protein I